MPRCGCASDQCSCFIIEGPNTTVSGSGTRNDPYVISAATVVVDTEGTPLPGAEDPTFIGQIIEYAGTTEPSDDYVPCDGRALSRAVHATLFTRIGTTYGAGDGSTTFNVPNTGGRTTISPDGTHDAGDVGGAEQTTILQVNLPAHAHGMTHTHTMITGGIHKHILARSDDVGGVFATIPEGQSTSNGSSSAAVTDDGAHTHAINNFTGNTGTGPGNSTPMDTMSPFVTIPKYIRVQGGP